MLVRQCPRVSYASLCLVQVVATSVEDNLVVRLFYAGEYFSVMSVPLNMHFVFSAISQVWWCHIGHTSPDQRAHPGLVVPAVQAFSFCPLDWNCTKMNTLTCCQKRHCVQWHLLLFFFLPPVQCCYAMC